ncbi:hypothetical protein SLA2020_447180 [Shorea laevis]
MRYSGFYAYMLIHCELQVTIMDFMATSLIFCFVFVHFTHTLLLCLLIIITQTSTHAIKFQAFGHAVYACPKVEKQLWIPKKVELWPAQVKLNSGQSLKMADGKMDDETSEGQMLDNQSSKNKRKSEVGSKKSVIGTPNSVDIAKIVPSKNTLASIPDSKKEKVGGGY